MIYCTSPFEFSYSSRTSFRLHPGPQSPHTDVCILGYDFQGQIGLCRAYYSYTVSVTYGFKWLPLPPELETLYHAQAYTALHQQLLHLHAP